MRRAPRRLLALARPPQRVRAGEHEPAVEAVRRAQRVEQRERERVVLVQEVGAEAEQERAALEPGGRAPARAPASATRWSMPSGTSAARSSSTRSSARASSRAWRRAEHDAVRERERLAGQLAVAAPLVVVGEVGGVVVGDRVELGEHDAPPEAAAGSAGPAASSPGRAGGRRRSARCPRRPRRATSARRPSCVQRRPRAVAERARHGRRAAARRRAAPARRSARARAPACPVSVGPRHEPSIVTDSSPTASRARGERARERDRLGRRRLQHRLRVVRVAAVELSSLRSWRAVRAPPNEPPPRWKT